jgi:pyruvate/2-oxoglutarate dehydrogenase complex dihydrolipoamide dehydrogenase (E3) component
VVREGTDATHDLLVVGGGSAGGGVATAAARAGVDVLLVERDRLGGECLNAGCVPSKALLRSAELAHLVRNSRHLGLGATLADPDARPLMLRVRDVIRDARGKRDEADTWTATPYPALHAIARFVAPQVAELTPHGGGPPRRIRFEQAVIATGSRTTIPPIHGLDEVAYLTSESVWELDAIPDRLVVIGGGPIGAELAQALSRLGSRVTIVESDRLLANEEPEASTVLAQAFADEGISLRLGRNVERVAPGLASLDDGEELPFDALLVAVGRGPELDGLSLDAAGVETRDGRLVLDDELRTSAPHIWAAGDVTGELPFVHVASAQAEVVAANALHGAHRSMTYDGVPWATFTDPEVARVGMLARAAGPDATLGRITWDELDRALTDGDTRGFVTVLAGPDGRILGAQLVGRSAGDLVGELALAMSAGLTVHQVRDAIHVYPTRSEGVRWACGAAADALDARRE